MFSNERQSLRSLSSKNILEIVSFFFVLLFDTGGVVFGLGLVAGYFTRFISFIIIKNN